MRRDINTDSNATGSHCSEICFAARWQWIKADQGRQVSSVESHLNQAKIDPKEILTKATALF
jgi:hypothetical protein